MTRILVLGLGLTGVSLVRWCVRCGMDVAVADSRTEPPGITLLRRDFPGLEIHLGAFAPSLLDGIDQLALSPGVPRSDPLVVRALERGIEVVSDIELFARRLRQHNAQVRAPRVRVLGITGSNGKSTVTSMAGAICRAAGMRCEVAGNIGVPVLDALTDAESTALPEVFVLELSSFQLESVSGLDVAAATMLNLSEDHLDRHGTMEAYARAKARIFEHCHTQVLNRDDPASVAMARPECRVWTFGLSAPVGPDQGGIRTESGRRRLVWADRDLLDVDDLPVAGLHNAANALAAYALCRAIGVSDTIAVPALKRFRGLPHRVEKVMERDGVTWFDDSKGTNVGATVAALEGFDRPVVLIAGGDGKGQDFAPLAPAVAAHARAVVLIGRDGPAIGSAIAATAVPQVRADSMEVAVTLASELAQAGDIVLLSPACASFDMFDNYEHRARVFVNAVRNLRQEFGVQGK